MRVYWQSWDRTTAPWLWKSERCVQQRGIPMVTTYPTNPQVTRNGNFSFMGAYTDPYQASMIANFAVQGLAATTAAGPHRNR